MAEITYLGEKQVDIKDTPFIAYENADWALYFVEKYGQIDGSHHKAWVLDQVARVLKGGEVVISMAVWDNGHIEYRVSVNPSKAYHNWVEHMETDEKGETYNYDKGIAP